MRWIWSLLGWSQVLLCRELENGDTVAVTIWYKGATSKSEVLKITDAVWANLLEEVAEDQ